MWRERKEASGAGVWRLRVVPWVWPKEIVATLEEPSQ